MSDQRVSGGNLNVEAFKEVRRGILTTLRQSMSRAGRPLALAGATPTIGTATENSAIATGTTWKVSDASGPIHAAKYTFVGANWKNPSAVFPNTEFYKGECARAGNGSNPEANPIYSGRVRFTCAAPSFEIYVQTAPAGAGDGFRLKVNGEYAKAGVLGVDGNGLFRYIPVTWGDGSAAHRKERFYELEFGGSGGFIGIRTTNLYKPAPWPQPDGLRVIIHGDSQLMTLVDSGNKDAALTPRLGLGLADYLGQADTWASGVGGSGWLAPTAKDRSWFNDRVSIDVAANSPDVVIELGGGNDAALITNDAYYQGLVEEWLRRVLYSRPEAIIFMFGPIITSNAGATHFRVQAAKRAAAAMFPQNVAFIDTLTDPLVSGTGKQDSTDGSGNRDWVCGSDGAHPTIEGHAYLASRLFNGIAGGIDALLEANT